MDELINGWMNG